MISTPLCRKSILLNKPKTPLRPPGGYPGGNGGENFFKNRQSYTKLRKGRLAANEDVSRPFWSLEPPQIPVSGSHNPEVAGSSPVSATTKKPWSFKAFEGESELD